MKKRTILLLACLFALSAHAQIEHKDDHIPDLDLSEDSMEVTTLQDIVKQQQKVSSTHDTERHFLEVWDRRSYFNFTFNSTTLSPKGTIPSGVENGTVRDMKTDWGASIQYGRNYRLHKMPISNILQFYFDFTGIDLNVNHYKAEGNGRGIYDSRQTIEVKDGYKTNTYYYYPWNMEKYEFNFGMSLGPSLTLAPFTSTSSRGLHYLKFNFYYHIGYHISFLYSPNDQDADLNEAKEKSDPNYKGKDEMADNLKMQWGHGLINSFGVNVSWKVIGIGYEYRSASLKYKAMNTSTFGKDKYDFKASTNRVYLQLRF